MNEKYTNIKEEVDDKRAKRDKLSKQLKKLEIKKLKLLKNIDQHVKNLKLNNVKFKNKLNYFNLLLKILFQLMNVNDY